MSASKVIATFNRMSTAVEMYRADYERLPQPRSIGELVFILNGLRDPITSKDVGNKHPELLAQNPLRNPYMRVERQRLFAPSLFSKQADGGTVLLDPWGTPYGFAFDNGIGGVYYLGPGTNNPTSWPDTKAGDGVIPLPFASADDTANVVRAGFAIFSNGPDGRTGTPETAKDDIRSWK